MKKYWVVLLSLMFVGPSAFADAKVSAVGGILYNLNSSATAIGYGGGLLVGMGSLEFGGIYFTRNSFSIVQIPVMARFGGGSATFGLGGFINAGDSSDYGLTAGPRIGGSGSPLFLDLRYNYGLKTGNTSNISALVGYSFGKGK